MAEKLFGFGFGYLIRLLRGDLSPALLLAAGAMLLLAAAVEVWGSGATKPGYRRNGAAIRRMRGSSPASQPKACCPWRERWSCGASSMECLSWPRGHFRHGAGRSRRRRIRPWHG